MAPAAWWVRPVVAGLVTALVYGAAWFGHWWYAVRLAARSDQQGLEERASRVRLTYFVWVAFIAVSYALAYVGVSLGAALRYVIGAWYTAWGQSIWGEIAVPLLTVLPLLVGWAWHRRRAIGESLALTGSPLRAVRPLDYMASFIGLMALASVMVWFLAEMIQRITGPGLGVGSIDDWRSSAAGAIGFMVAAAPFWLWPWLAGQRRLSRDRIREASSTARRAFLFAVSGLAVAAAALSAAFIVYRLTRVATGLNSTSFGSDIRVPLCAVIVAVPLLAFHAYWLRRDLAETHEAAQPTSIAGAAAIPSPAALAPSAQPATSTQELVIDVPAEADLEPIRAWLVTALPVGYTVSVRSKPGTGPD
jgi:DNA segregation ATPase FtsK/SpoIIIE-like protein